MKKNCTLIKNFVIISFYFVFITSLHAETDRIEALEKKIAALEQKLNKFEKSATFKETKNTEVSNKEKPNSTASSIEIPKLKLTKSLRKDSPNFLLGKETGPNMRVTSEDNPDLGFYLGVRFMGTAEYANSRKSSGSFGQGDWDFYARRVRFEAGAQFTKDMKFMMDLRNDRSNQDDRGEENFNIGDAKLTIKNLWDQKWLNSAFYRAKVDVSRAQTVKSAFLVNYDRAPVADSAANWVSHNRRATNAQLFGDFNKKIHYSLAVGDGITGSSFRDAKGGKGASISGQSSPMLGYKIRLSPFDGWEETKRTETYFGVGKHFSVGVGQFYLNSIDLKPVAGAQTTEIDRELTNIELSAHYEGAFIQAEYFYFDGAVEDLSASTLNVGNASGWYVLGEYVIPSLNYLAPFARYDSWNRFSDLDGYVQETLSTGINWYLKGNSTKVGFVFQRDNYENATGRDDSNTFRIVSQLFF